MNKYYLIICMLTILSFPTLKAQVMYHTGKMAVGTPAVTNGASLLIHGDLKAVGSSEIKHTGKTVLTGNFISNITDGHVFTQRNGTFEFRGSSVQRIQGTANKAVNYIEFPNTVIVNNSNTAYNYDSAVVIIDPAMGVSMKDISLTKGRLVIDSKVSGEKTDIAHLLVDGTIDYTRLNNTSTKHLDGIIQVNLAMGNNATEGRLVGFSSPFETIFADYFFFNFLSDPNPETFFAGNKDMWNTDPLMEMPAGQGYVLGQGIVPHSNNPADLNNPSFYYNSHKNSKYPLAQYADVAKDRFSFARVFAPTSIMVATSAKRFIGEKLNTSTVNVSIQEGFNYLGNPFTVPLDLSKYITSPTSGIWGTFAAYEMEPAFYILTPGSKGEYLGNDLFSFTASYLVGQKVGSTADSKILAPMQMFAVKKRTSGTNTFKINASERTHGITSFLRSDENTITDELLIETKDNTTGGFDRLCIVFRKEASLQGTDTYDAEKLFNTTGGVNQIYTCSSDNKKLTTNVVPNTTPQLVMYFEPSSTVQEVTLTADRINSLQAISHVELEDTKTGIKTDLLSKPLYVFTSDPSDKPDRFILHFTHNPFGISTLRSDATPNVSYSSGAIYVNGLQDKEIGKTISVYNMQGQLLHHQKVTEIAPCKINKALNAGIYMVKIEYNTHVMKLVVTR